MTTSGTYNFSPSNGEIILRAFSRIGVESKDITANHMENARFEANLLQAEWSNKGPNLWTVDLVSVPLIAGQPTYSVDSNTVMILDAYLSSIGSADITILPISRSEYAGYSNKNQLSTPSCFWFDRLISPTITVWPAPSGNKNYTLKYYRYRQIQDVLLEGGSNAEIPFLWLDALTAAMAHRLARYHARPLEMLRKQDAIEAYNIAATQNVEKANLYISPMISGYYK